MNFRNRSLPRLRDGHDLGSCVANFPAGLFAQYARNVAGQLFGARPFEDTDVHIAITVQVDCVDPPLVALHDLI
jgi:hypothetical protein